MPHKRSEAGKQRQLEREAKRYAARRASKARQRDFDSTDGARDDFAGHSTSVRSISQQSGFKVGATGFRVASKSRSGEVTHKVREARTDRIETADADGEAIELIERTALVDYAQSQLKRAREGKVTHVVTDTRKRDQGGVMVNGELQFKTD